MSRFVSISTFACLLAALTGCAGEKLTSVSGVVTLDGKPVEGATVTFASEDGKTTASGSSDASGNFSLMSGEKTGAPAGNYKVMVTKSQYTPTAEAPDPSGMMKMAPKDVGKGAPKGTGPLPGGGTGAPKTELPGIYAGTTSPLTAKVPSDGPVKVEMKSKP